VTILQQGFGEHQSSLGIESIRKHWPIRSLNDFPEPW